MNLEFTKHFLIRLLSILCLKMLMLGDLQIRILKMLTEKPLSTIGLYDVLTKNGVEKLAFENAIKSLEKKKFICIESLLLRLTENGRKMSEILETLGPQSDQHNKVKRNNKDLVSKPPRPEVKNPPISKRIERQHSPPVEQIFVGTYVSRRGRAIPIYNEGRRYRIGKNKLFVNESLVNKVDEYLRKSGNFFSIAEIAAGLEKCYSYEDLRPHIWNALRVLISRGKIQRYGSGNNIRYFARARGTRKAD